MTLHGVFVLVGPLQSGNHIGLARLIYIVFAKSIAAQLASRGVSHWDIQVPIPLSPFVIIEFIKIK